MTANGPGAATATGVVVGGGGGAHSLGASNAAVIRRGNSIKEHQERRARLLADLGDGTVLVAWGNTGVEEVSLASKKHVGPYCVRTVESRNSRKIGGTCFCHVFVVKWHSQKLTHVL